MEQVKSVLQKGALYLIDDEFRQRSQPSYWTEFRAKMGTGTKLWALMSLKYGSEYITDWQPYKNSIALLVDTKNHGNADPDRDICKIYLNNSSSIRYTYRAMLEMAKRLDR